MIKREEIEEGYLIRYTLFECRYGRAYLHHFVGSDPCKDLHDHPKNFVSIGLRGYYYEEVPHGTGSTFKRFSAPWCRWFPYSHRHRIELRESGSCWTLCFVTASKAKGWGFWKDGVFRKAR